MYPIFVDYFDLECRQVDQEPLLNLQGGVGMVEKDNMYYKVEKETSQISIEKLKSRNKLEGNPTHMSKVHIQFLCISIKQKSINMAP